MFKWYWAAGKVWFGVIVSINLCCVSSTRWKIIKYICISIFINIKWVCRIIRFIQQDDISQSLITGGHICPLYGHCSICNVESSNKWRTWIWKMIEIFCLEESLFNLIIIPTIIECHGSRSCKITKAILWFNVFSHSWLKKTQLVLFGSYVLWNKLVLSLRLGALDSNRNWLGFEVFLSKVSGFLQALWPPPPIKPDRHEIAQMWQ